jgi:hypothetical protein
MRTTSGSAPSTIALSLPFVGLWMVQNSPARRVPSHGSNLFGERYAIDFLTVDDRRRSAAVRDWRTLVATEPPERFFAFGQPILAPLGGVVVDVHDGEIDHEGRRSQLALVPYALGQAARLRRGVTALSGNYVTISVPGASRYVAMAHLRAGSVRVGIGQQVEEGEQIGECGNSGNSTQPHVHIQAMDSADLSVAHGVPMSFRAFREWPSGATGSHDRELGMPDEGSVVEPWPDR